MSLKGRRQMTRGTISPLRRMVKTTVVLTLPTPARSSTELAEVQRHAVHRKVAASETKQTKVEVKAEWRVLICLT